MIKIMIHEEYKELKDYFRARTRQFFKDNVVGFELLNEKEQIKILDNYLVQMFLNKEDIIPSEIILDGEEIKVKYFMVQVFEPYMIHIPENHKQS